MNINHTLGQAANLRQIAPASIARQIAPASIALKGAESPGRSRLRVIRALDFFFIFIGGL